MSFEFVFYPKLSTRSRRAIGREKKRWGHPYHYYPRRHLVGRLMAETGWTYGQVVDQLFREREELIRQKRERF